MDLESHWTASERPYAKITGNKIKDENYFEVLMEKYPVPEDYQDSLIQEDKDAFTIRDSLKAGKVVKF